MHTEHRDALASAARRLAAEGLVLGTSGNLSMRVEDHVVVTPTGAALAELEPGQTTIVDLEGTLVEGPLAPTSELFLHLGVYARLGGGAVIHTHSPMATALSCVLDEVPLIHYNMLAFGGTLRVAPYETFGTPELAEGVLAALEGRSAALMANHGAVCFGPDLASAVELSLLLEWTCAVYWRAAAIGTPRLLDDRDMQDVIESVQARGYGLRPAQED